MPWRARCWRPARPRTPKPRTPPRPTRCGAPAATGALEPETSSVPNWAAESEVPTAQKDPVFDDGDDDLDVPDFLK